MTPGSQLQGQGRSNLFGAVLLQGVVELGNPHRIVTYRARAFTTNCAPAGNETSSNRAASKAFGTPRRVWKDSHPCPGSPN